MPPRWRATGVAIPIVEGSSTRRIRVGLFALFVVLVLSFASPSLIAVALIPVGIAAGIGVIWAQRAEELRRSLGTKRRLDGHSPQDSA